MESKSSTQYSLPFLKVNSILFITDLWCCGPVKPTETSYMILDYTNKLDFKQDRTKGTVM